MTAITINGKKDVMVESNKLLKELVVDVFALEDRRSNSVISVKVNGADLDFLDYTLLDKRIDQVNEISFITKSKSSLVLSALTSCQEHILVASEKIDIICDYYSKNLVVDANLHMTELVDTMDYFIRTIAQIKNTVRTISKDRFETMMESHNHIEIHLISLLKSLLFAHQTSDLVMLTDLLEYELKDNLMMWKEKIIPSIENVMTT